RVHLGPDLRRGLAELDGQGETVGGVVVMRHGQNALRVIDGVKEKLRSIAPSLPPGVEIVPVYDRSTLIERAIDTLRHTLVEELLIVSGVILLFLWHLPSALIPIFTIPIAVAAVLAITLDPAMRLLFTRFEPFSFSPGWLRRVANAVLVGTIHGEDTHPVSRPLMRLYHPVVELVLRFRWLTVALAVLVV